MECDFKSDDNSASSGNNTEGKYHVKGKAIIYIYHDKSTIYLRISKVCIVQSLF